MRTASNAILAPISGTTKLRQLKPLWSASQKPRSNSLSRISLPALMTLAMSGSSTQDAGLASGLVGTTAQVGGVLGLAVLATISTARSQELLVAGTSLDSALTSGYHLAFGISAGLVLSSIAIAATVVRGTPLFR